MTSHASHVLGEQDNNGDFGEIKWDSTRLKQQQFPQFLYEFANYDSRSSSVSMILFR